MSSVTKRYTYFDPDIGDNVNFTYTSNRCKCTSNCNADELVFIDADYNEEYKTIVYASESKWLIQDLIEFAVASGKVVEVD